MFNCQVIEIWGKKEDKNRSWVEGIKKAERKLSSAQKKEIAKTVIDVLTMKWVTQDKYPIEGYLKGFLRLPKGKYSSNPLPKSITTWSNYWLHKALSRCAKTCTKNEQPGCKNVIFEIKRDLSLLRKIVTEKKKKKPGKIWVGSDYYQDVQESWEKPPSNRKFKQINNIWLTESSGHL